MMMPNWTFSTRTVAPGCLALSVNGREVGTVETIAAEQHRVTMLGLATIRKMSLSEALDFAGLAALALLEAPHEVRKNITQFIGPTTRLRRATQHFVRRAATIRDALRSDSTQPRQVIQ
ncbi:MAG: hypothetical protein HQL40_03300 [Alphaproteobacteria bacterium]|nr:hypothetical protein [Alphaproteobacteria bacterium]